MVILGSMGINFWVSFWAATTLILGASYTLWMYKRVIFGPIASDSIAKLKDLSLYELLAFMLLAIFVIVLGVYPNTLFGILHQSLHQILMLAYKTKI